MVDSIRMRVSRCEYVFFRRSPLCLCPSNAQPDISCRNALDWIRSWVYPDIDMEFVHVVRSLPCYHHVSFTFLQIVHHQFG